MKRVIFLCLGSISLASPAQEQTPAPSLSLRWEMGCNGVEKGFYTNSFTLINNGDTPLGSDWCIYFNQLPRKIKQEENAPVRIEVVNADFFRMTPTAHFKGVAAKDSLVIPFSASSGLIKYAHGPSGAYLVQGEKGRPVVVPIRKVPFTEDCQWSRPGTAEIPYPDGEYVYAAIEALQPVKAGVTDLIPTLKSVAVRPGTTRTGKRLAIKSREEFSGESQLLSRSLTSLYGASVEDHAPFVITLDTLPADVEAVNDEHYLLEIAPNGVSLRGNTPHAIFNGTQTLLSLMKENGTESDLPLLTISDYPDLPYRGQMIDVARNFIAKENLMKLIDILSSYKINALHLHATDDEGWRLEIPGLPELTEVGGHRGHTVDEATCLKPSFGSGPFADDPHSAGNGFYTKDDFIEILRYAAERHVRVIPEVDMPGHARAAIVAMKARYKKYIDTDPEEAQRYLLHDPQDTSRYSSAQSYSDNVVCVAAPSTYRFIGKVMDGIADMYREAGVPLESIHIGGDEVPRGSWSGSPVAQELMKRENIGDVRELSAYFFRKVSQLCDTRGLRMAGWQEIALDGKEKVNPAFLGRSGDIYCWNTVPEWGGDVYPVRLANAGYPVILCNANNFYFDLSYNKHEEEPGLHWAGFVNEVNSFNLQPYSVYRSARTAMNGKRNDLREIEAGKPKLTEQGRRNIVGVQGELWSENILTFPQTEYALFPKMYGLIERGWNARPEWAEIADPQGEERAYREALSRYYAAIMQRELPYLSRRGVNFRVNQPGLMVKEGVLYANSEVPGAEIRYTVDGSVPTRQSALWSAPVPLEKGVSKVRAKLFYLGNESVATLLRISQE